MADSTPFDPFRTNVDEGAALSILRGAVAGADDGELFLERQRSEMLSFDDGRLRTASYDTSQGFGLRTVLGGAAGYAHASELSEAAMKRAAETARMAARDGGGTLAPPPQGTNRRLYQAVDPVGDDPLALKIGEPGSELLAPLAVVVLGGLITSTLLNMLVVPVGYLMFCADARSKAERDDPLADAGV